jgi:hypothetical protein
MSKPRTLAQESAEDIFFGQIAIIWARWFLIAAGAIIALWSATSVLQIVVSITVVIALMSINFFTHGRYLMERPANKLLLAATNVIDVAVITLLVIAWPGQTGMNSHFFVLYYPLLFAFALVFSPGITAIFSIFTLGLYAAAVLVATDFNMLFTIGGFEVLATRLITLGAMGGLGTFYYRRQRDSLRTATRILPNAK